MPVCLYKTFSRQTCQTGWPGTCTQPTSRNSKTDKNHIHHRKQGDSEPRPDNIAASYTSPQRSKPRPCDFTPPFFFLTYTTAQSRLIFYFLFLR